jgi:hypothetical protein
MLLPREGEDPGPSHLFLVVLQSLSFLPSFLLFLEHTFRNESLSIFLTSFGRRLYDVHPQIIVLVVL